MWGVLVTEMLMEKSFSKEDDVPLAMIWAEVCTWCGNEYDQYDLLSLTKHHWVGWISHDIATFDENETDISSPPFLLSLEFPLFAG